MKEAFTCISGVLAFVAMLMAAGASDYRTVALMVGAWLLGYAVAMDTPTPTLKPTQKPTAKPTLNDMEPRNGQATH